MTTREETVRLLMATCDAIGHRVASGEIVGAPAADTKAWVAAMVAILDDAGLTDYDQRRSIREEVRERYFAKVLSELAEGRGEAPVSRQ